MSKSVDAVIREFFERYAAASGTGELETIASAYFKTYLESSPAQVVAYTVDDEYRKALAAKTAAMKEQFGLSRTEVSVKDIQKFAPAHALVTVEWTLQFNVPGKQAVTSAFLISYLVRMDGDRPSILAYVSHEDEQAALKKAGVI